MILPNINRHLLSLKAAYFFYAFSYFSIGPFIPTFLRQIGLDAEQTGIINGSGRFIQCLSGPLWGIVADKKRKHKCLLLIQITGASMLMFVTPWIPKILSKDVNRLCTTSKVHNTTAYSLRQYVQSTGIGISDGIVNKIRNADTLNLTLENINHNLYNLRPSVKSNNGRGIFEGIVNKVKNADPLNLTLENSNQSNNTNTSSCQSVINIYLFPTILIALNIVAIFNGGILLLLDTLVMDMIKSRHRSTKIDFGKQRLWYGVGSVLASFASGLGVQLSGSGRANYLTMFCINLVSNICLLLVCLKFRPSIDHGESVEEKEQKNIGKGFLLIMKHLDLTFFFSTVFVEGFANALLAGFLFWYIKDLSGTEILMGASNMVSGTSNIIAFLIAERFIKFAGDSLTAINVSIFLYSVRFFGMSYVTNAWYILFLQLFEGMVFAIFWVAAIKHASLISPPGLTTTFLGILNGVYYGMSAGISIIVGGIWIKKFGGKSMFRCFSIVSAIWSFIVLLYILSRKGKQMQHPNLDNELEAALNATEPKPLLKNKPTIKYNSQVIYETYV